jgi:hypothetical protein
MNEISTIDPEKFLKSSEADLFQIILVSTVGHFIYAGGAFANIEHGGFNTGIVHERADLAKAYWEATQFARSDFGNIPLQKEKVQGRLEIVEIPRFVVE